MSVNYEAVWAYGYLVDETDAERIDQMCQKHGAMYQPIGDAYAGDVKFIITSKNLAQSVDYGYTTPRPAAEPEEVQAIINTVKDVTGNYPTEDPKSYLGMYIS